MELRTEKWKEFKIGDLFDVHKIKGINQESLTDYTEEEYYNYITRTSLNNGVHSMTGKIESAELQNENTFSLGLLGMDFFYQKRPWYAGQFVRCITPKFKINNALAAFFATILNKRSELYKNDLIREFDSIFLNDTIPLPEKDGVPDWSFMEEYISFIENRYIDKIEENNKVKIGLAMEVTGITEEELDGELAMEEPKRVNEFRVGDLFEIKPTKNYGFTNDILYVNDGSNPVIANSSQNNGITGYTNLDNTESGNKITFSDTTDHNSIFYQPKDFVGYSHVQGLYPLKYEEKWNKQTYQYFLILFKKVASGYGFSYGYKFNRKIASDFLISLPAIDKSTPDFEYMEKTIYIYITAKIKDWKLAGEEKVRMLRRIILK